MTNAITIADSVSTSSSGANGQTIWTGTPTSGSVATFSAPSAGTVAIDISGTWAGTLSFEESPDGVNYTAVDALQDGVDTVAQSTTANGLFKIAAAADYQVRVRATASITGTANVAFTGSSLTDLQHVAVVDGGNVDTGALLTFAAAGAGTLHSADQTNYSGTGLNCLINITAATTATLVLTIQGKDVASGTYYTILTSASLSSVAATLLSVFPGLTVAANTVASAILPRTWRVTAVITGGSASLTGTVGASVV